VEKVPRLATRQVGEEHFPWLRDVSERPVHVPTLEAREVGRFTGAQIIRRTAASRDNSKREDSEDDQEHGEAD
jgi:hypothetical protein